MAGSRGPSFKKVLGVYIGGSALVGVLVVGALHGMALGIAGWRQRLAERHWAEAGLPVKDYMKSLPHHSADVRAQRLDEAGKALGLSLLRFRTESEAPDAKELESRREQVRDYLKGQLESPSAHPSPPPEELAQTLRESEMSLRGVRTILLEGPPVWQMEPSKGNAAEIPSLLDQIDLSELLAADALAARASRQDGRAREDLEAAWNLAEGLTENPILLVRLIELAMRNRIAATVRKADVPPTAWEKRLSSWDPQERMAGALRMDAAVVDGWASSSDPINAIEGGAPRRNPIVWLGTPYFRFTAARMMDYQLAILRELQSLDPCASDEEILVAGKVEKSQIPAWDKISSIALTEYGPCWARARYCRIQIDLTRNVLALRAEREKLGRWPANFAPVAWPECPSESWLYSVTPGGEMALRFIGPEPTEAILKVTAIHPAQAHTEPAPSPIP